MYMYMYMYIHFRFPSSKLRHYTYMCVCYTVFVELVFLTNSHGHYHPFDRDKVVYIVAWFLYFWKQLCMAVKTGNDTKYSQPIFSEDGTDTGILFLLYMYMYIYLSPVVKHREALLVLASSGGIGDRLLEYLIPQCHSLALLLLLVLRGSRLWRWLLLQGSWLWGLLGSPGKYRTVHLHRE